MSDLQETLREPRRLHSVLPGEQTLREIEYLSGKKDVMGRRFSVSNAQVNGAGDNLGEQVRPLLQVDDVRALTGGDQVLLHPRDVGFFRVDMPELWRRAEMSGLLRDVGQRSDKHAHLAGNSARIGYLRV